MSPPPRKTPSSPSRGLGKVGPGATALTRIAGAKACAIMRVADHKADLVSA